MSGYLKFMVLWFVVSLLACGSVGAVELEGDGAVHKVVIQVNTADPETQAIALNNAVNFQKHYGMDNAQIEVVAYGPGLGILTEDGPQSSRVSSLAMQNIAFSACGNTLAKLEKKLGQAPKLAEGVGVVPAGVVRISELQEQGYVYIRP